MGKLFEDQLNRVKQQYPHIGDGWQIAAMGVGMDSLSGTPSDIQDRAAYLENEDGFFADAALTKALDEHVIRMDAPDGFMFVRLEKDGERPLLVLLNMQEAASPREGLFSKLQRFFGSRPNSAAA